VGVTAFWWNGLEDKIVWQGGTPRYNTGGRVRHVGLDGEKYRSAGMACCWEALVTFLSGLACLCCGFLATHVLASKLSWPNPVDLSCVRCVCTCGAIYVYVCVCVCVVCVCSSGTRVSVELITTDGGGTEGTPTVNSQVMYALHPIQTLVPKLPKVCYTQLEGRRGVGVCGCGLSLIQGLDMRVQELNNTEFPTFLNSN